MPAFIRLSLESLDDEFYFEQLLFHLENDGENNSLILSCSKEQRAFIALFVKHMIETYAKEIDYNVCADEALRVYELWASAQETKQKESFMAVEHVVEPGKNGFDITLSIFSRSLRLQR